MRVLQTRSGMAQPAIRIALPRTSGEAFAIAGVFAILGLILLVAEEG